MIFKVKVNEKLQKYHLTISSLTLVRSAPYFTNFYISLQKTKYAIITKASHLEKENLRVYNTEGK